MGIDGGGDSLSPFIFINTDVIDIQGQDIRHVIRMRTMLKLTHRIANDPVLFIYSGENGPVFIRKDRFQFGFRILCGAGDEDVRAQPGMHFQHLHQQFSQSRNILCFCFSYTHFSLSFGLRTLYASEKAFCEERADSMAEIKVEICTGSICDVITASAFPIDRIELNCALELGGLSPSPALLEAAAAHTRIPILCMVRPRSAGFCYSQEEFSLMMKDAELFLEHGAAGIVFGFLKEDRTIDKERTEKMAQLAHRSGREAVFHRAFDEAVRPFESVETLISCGIDRLLTSGGMPTALQGADLIRSIIQRYGSRIEILPGAGINETNVSALIEKTQCTQIHLSAKSMRHDLHAYPCCDKERIRAVLEAVRGVR